MSRAANDNYAMPRLAVLAGKFALAVAFWAPVVAFAWSRHG